MSWRTPPRRASGSRCWPASCVSCAARGRAAARPRPPHHRHYRRGRRARLVDEPGRRRPARQPGPVRPRGRGLPGGRRRRHPAGAAGLPDRRGRPGQRSRRGHPDRGRLGQAADRAPLQGARVGRVFLVGACEGRFPSTRSRTLWTSSPAVLPGTAARRRRRPAPARVATTRPRSTSTGRTPRHTVARRSCGSATSRSPAPAHRLSVTSYLLVGRGPTPLRPVGLPGASCATSCVEWGEPDPAVARQAREGHPQPVRRPDDLPRPGRVTGVGLEAARRLEAAAAGPRRSIRHGADDDDSTWSRAARVAEWDAELDAAARRGPGGARRRGRRAAAGEPVRHRRSPGCSADPEAFAARPGPADAAAAVAGGAVRHPVPRLGRGAVRPAGRSSTPTTCPAAPTPASTTTPTSRTLIERFETGPFADRVPHAVEAPFALVLAGQVVRGRIDAVYAEPRRRAGWSSTGRPTATQTADPLQLALYRLAWAELRGVPARAGARGVPLRPQRGGRRADDLPDRAELEAVLGRGQLRLER